MIFHGHFNSNREDVWFIIEIRQIVLERDVYCLTWGIITCITPYFNGYLYNGTCCAFAKFQVKHIYSDINTIMIYTFARMDIHSLTHNDFWFATFSLQSKFNTVFYKNTWQSIKFVPSTYHPPTHKWTQIAKFMGPTRGPPGSCRTQMGPMLAPWTLLWGVVPYDSVNHCEITRAKQTFLNQGMSIHWKIVQFEVNTVKIY